MFSTEFRYKLNNLRRILKKATVREGLVSNF